MLSPADVNREADFVIGSLRVSPAARRVDCGHQTVTVEPRVMQVLLMLARRPNEVVTRGTLFDEIWGTSNVGDDSLNRAVAGVRKLVALDPGALSLETIPRTGYRLNVVGTDDRATDHAPDRPALSRRQAVIGSAAAVSLAGAGLWAVRSSDDREFARLMRRSDEALSYGDPSNNPIPLLERAVALRPDDAGALGLLAYAQAVETNRARASPEALRAADGNSRAALAIDPTEPNARLARAAIEQATMDLNATEDLLLSILKTAPNNLNAIKLYWNVLQCVGRSHDALAMVRRALKIDPLGASMHYPLAQLLWITGRVAEADRVIDQAIKTWPEHRGVRFARFIILAFTGRERVALATLDSPATAPQAFSPESIALWRISLPALEQRSPPLVAAAIKANAEAARSNLGITSQATMVLSRLGALDQAFEAVNALFVVPSAATAQPTDKAPASSASWRFAPWLFIPPISPMWRDPRFGSVCDTAGLSAYWARRGVRPDYPIG